MQENNYLVLKLMHPRLKYIIKYSICFFWWLYSFIFIYYIFRKYLLTIPDYQTKWNFTLPRLGNNWHEALLMGLHFGCGIIILFFGQIQLFTAHKYNYLHRYIGKIYIMASITISLCGMIYIILYDTVGGTNMSASFFIYGTLLLTCSIFTCYHALIRNIPDHREWALRTFTLGLCSWIYRIFYMIAQLFGYHFDSKNYDHYQRPLDLFFIWAFYFPFLLFIEFYICLTRHRNTKRQCGYRSLA